MIKIIILFLTTIKLCFASTLFAPDSDTALLLEMLVTTTAQLNELERLTTHSEALSGDLKKYNEVIVDHWYRAQRVAIIVEKMSTLSSKKPKNIDQLNNSLHELKYEISQLEDIIVKYGIIKAESQSIADSTIKDDATISQESKLAELHIKRSHKEKNVGNIQKVNAQVNAYSHKHLVDIKNKVNQQTHLLSKQNEIQATKEETKAKKELLEQRFYGLKEIR